MAENTRKAKVQEVQKKRRAEKEGRFDRVTPSGLPTLEQCPRAWAIQRDYEKARKAHPDLPEDGVTYKMVFGTIFHKVMELGGYKPKEVYQTAVDSVGEDKLKYDYSYKNVKHLAQGVYGAVKVFLNNSASRPWREREKSGAKFELKCEGEFEGIKMAGIVDCIDSGVVSDLKTTTPSNKTWHGSQLTAYWMLARTQQEGIEDQARVVKVFRPSKPDGNSGVETLNLSAALNEPHVRRLIRLAKKIRDAMPKWEGDYRVIANNPSADRCRYCPARGTTACPETRTW